MHHIACLLPALQRHNGTSQQTKLADRTGPDESSSFALSSSSLDTCRPTPPLSLSFCAMAVQECNLAHNKLTEEGALHKRAARSLWVKKRTLGRPKQILQTMPLSFTFVTGSWRNFVLFFLPSDTGQGDLKQKWGIGLLLLFVCLLFLHKQVEQHGIQSRDQESPNCGACGSAKVQPWQERKRHSSTFCLPSTRQGWSKGVQQTHKETLTPTT